MIVIVVVVWYLLFFIVIVDDCAVFMFGLGLFMVISFTWRNFINNPLL